MSPDAGQPAQTQGRLHQSLPASRSSSPSGTFAAAQSKTAAQPDVLQDPSLEGSAAVEIAAPAKHEASSQPQSSTRQSPWQRRQPTQTRQMMPDTAPSNSSADQREQRAGSQPAHVSEASQDTMIPPSSATPSSPPTLRASHSSSSSSFHHPRSMSSFGAAATTAEAYSLADPYRYPQQQQPQPAFMSGQAGIQAPPPPSQHQHLYRSDSTQLPPPQQQAYQAYQGGGRGMQYAADLSGATAGYGPAMHPQAAFAYGSSAGLGGAVAGGAGAQGGLPVSAASGAGMPQQHYQQQQPPPQGYASSPPQSGMHQQPGHESFGGPGRTDSASSAQWPPTYAYSPYTSVAGFYPSPTTPGPMPPQPYVSASSPEYAQLAAMGYHESVAASPQFAVPASSPGPWAQQHYPRQQPMGYAPPRGPAPALAASSPSSRVGYRGPGSQSRASRTPLRQDTRSTGEPAEGAFAPSPTEAGSGDSSYGKLPVGLRSEHVMWVGNVPANASQAELRAFFSQLPADAQDVDEPSLNEAAPHGIVSIFIIARSNCAFVNYSTPSRLDRAVLFFNGHPLRPQDPRCPKLVCRIRKKSDEVQAGVGGQRGKGLHVAFLKEYRRRESEKLGESRGEGEGPVAQGASASPSTNNKVQTDCLDVAGLSLSDTSNLRGEAVASLSSPNTLASVGSSSIGSSSAEVSYTSTNSGLLGHPAFRTRYFILKSRTLEELERSVETRTWATQPHNEAVLAQAFRNSDKVILVFSANGSGAFFGYARMAGSIPGREAKADQSQETEAVAASEQDAPSGPTLVTSPQALTPNEEAQKAEMLPATATGLQTGKKALTDDGVMRRDMVASGQPSAGMDSSAATSVSYSSSLTPGDSASSDARAATQLATRAIIHNLRIDQRESQRKAEQLERQLAVQENLAASGKARVRDSEVTTTPAAKQDGGRSIGTATPTPTMTLLPSTNTSTAAEGASVSGTSPSPSSEEVLGHSFSVEWVQTKSLPFTAVKHLRNPWNENKSLRIARDGTEIAIDTAVELLGVWEKYVEGGQASASTATAPAR